CWDEKIIEYSPYGSRLIPSNLFTKEQLEIKNSPEFYQKAPFLTIAKELLKLVRENKVKQIIFLSAYDKRKFPNGDPRKKQIFKETFENASDFDIVIDDNPSICKNIAESIPNVIVCAPHYPAIENQHQEKQLTMNNGSVCQTCVDEDLANYEKDKKEGRINDAVIFCQDCQSQYRQKREEGKIGVNPHKLTNQHDRAMELHEGEPYIIHAMILTE
ncbi:13515_t:CDS:2, partial [Ambispora leptoticha]